MNRNKMLMAALAFALGGCAMAEAQDAAQSDLASRVQELEDEREIRRVLIKYGEFLDARDYASYANLFAREGVWSGGFGTFTGPAAIKAMLEENMGAFPDDYVNQENFHLNTTMVVDVEGDSAAARSRYLSFTRTPEDRPSVLLAGRYEDTLVREDGAWKIMTRKSHGVIPYRDGNAPPPAERPAGLSPQRED